MLANTTQPQSWDRMLSRHVPATWGGAKIRRRPRPSPDPTTPATYRQHALRSESAGAFVEAPEHLKAAPRPKQESAFGDVVAEVMRVLGTYWAQTEAATLRQELAQLHTAHAHLFDAHRRMDTLARLEHDWDTYGAAPPTPVAISVAHGLLLAIWAELAKQCPAALAPWTVVPLHSGGLQVEWKGPVGHLEVEIAPTGELSYLVERDNLAFDESEDGVDVSVDSVADLVRSVLVG